MADLTSLLQRSTPHDLPELDRHDLVELSRGARRRVRRRRAARAVAGLAVLGLVASAVTGRGPRPGAPGEEPPVWRGPGGEALEEPVGAWIRAEDPPFGPRVGAFGATLSDGRVLVWGGHGDRGPATDGGVYDPSSGAWHAIPPPPVDIDLQFGAFERQVQLARDRLAIVHTDPSRPRGEAVAAVYDVGRSRWTTSPAVGLEATPLDAAVVAWDGQTLVLLPLTIGLPSYGSPAAWRWTVGEESWKRGATAPIPMRTGVGRAFDGRRLALWGGSINGLVQSDGAIYDVATDRWQAMPAGPVPGAEQPLVTWLDDRVVVSQSLANRVPVPPEQIGALAAFDPPTGRWEPIPPAPDYRPVFPLPYATSDGTAFVSPGRGSPERGTGTPRYLVYSRSPGGDAAAGASFLVSGRWEQAPYDNLFRLGAFTVAVGGLDTFRRSCCPGPVDLRLVVRTGRDRWLAAGEPPFATRLHETIVATGDKLVVVGGLLPAEPRDGPGTFTNETWVFDLAG